MVHPPVLSISLTRQSLVRTEFCFLRLIKKKNAGKSMPAFDESG